MSTSRCWRRRETKRTESQERPGERVTVRRVLTAVRRRRQSYAERRPSYYTTRPPRRVAGHRCLSRRRRRAMKITPPVYTKKQAEFWAPRIWKQWERSTARIVEEIIKVGRTFLKAKLALSH